MLYGRMIEPVYLPVNPRSSQTPSTQYFLSCMCKSSRYDFPLTQWPGMKTPLVLPRGRRSFPMFSRHLRTMPQKAATAGRNSLRPGYTPEASPRCPDGSDRCRCCYWGSPSDTLHTRFQPRPENPCGRSSPPRCGAGHVRLPDPPRETAG